MQLEFISHLYCLFYGPCNRLSRLSSHTERETKFREGLGVDETFVVGRGGEEGKGGSRVVMTLGKSVGEGSQ